MTEKEKFIEEMKKFIREEALSIPLVYQSSLAEVRVIDVENFVNKLANTVDDDDN